MKIRSNMGGRHCGVDITRKNIREFGGVVPRNWSRYQSILAEHGIILATAQETNDEVPSTQNEKPTEPDNSRNWMKASCNSSAAVAAA